jgi:hypothetical protein
MDITAAVARTAVQRESIPAANINPEYSKSMRSIACSEGEEREE